LILLYPHILSKKVNGDIMNGAFVHIIEEYGYIGIALLIFIENVFPPIPSEAVLLGAGFLTLSTTLAPVGVIIAATVGAFAGAVVLYALGRMLKKERLKRLVDGNIGQVLRLKGEYVDSADEWFTKYGNKAVFICRCVPVLRSLISIPAGIADMPFVPFAIFTVLGSTLWNILLVALGVLMGDAWELCMPYFKRYEHITMAFIAIACFVLALWLVRKNNKING